MRRRLRAVPASLAVLLAVTAALAAAWSCVLPGLQGQDEISHAGYVQRIAERHKIVWNAVTGVRAEDEGKRAPYSTETYRTVLLTGVGPLAGNAAMRPYGTDVDEDRWRERIGDIGAAERSDVGYASSMSNPPLYYLYETPVYAAFREASMLDRGFAMRIATIPFLLLAVIATWLLAGEVLGRRRWLQTVAAGAVALQPLLVQLGGVLNPDPALTAFSTLSLWLSAVIVNRGLSRGRAAGLVAVTLAAALSHGRGAAMFAPAGLALAIGAWRATAPHAASARRAAFGAAAAVTAGAGALAVWAALRGDVTATRLREFGSYLWQFYLPRLDSMQPAPLADFDARDVYVDRFYSGFAQLEVNLGPGVLDALAVASALGVVALIAALVARRRTLRPRLALIAVFAVALVAVALSLHVVSWRELQIPAAGSDAVFGTDPIITGRHLFPLVGLFGVAIAAVASVLPRRAGPAFGVAVLLTGVLLNLSALGAALTRFHA